MADRFWNGIKLPVGVYVYEGARKQYIELVFKYNDRIRHEMFTGQKSEKIDLDDINEAGRDVTKIKKEIKSGTFIFEAWFPLSRTLTINDTRRFRNANKVYFTDFIHHFGYDLRPQKNKKKRSESTVYNYIKLINAIGRYFDGMLIHDIKKADLIKWVISLEGINKKKTVKNKWSMISMAFERATNLDIIKENPVTQVYIKDLLINWSVEKTNRTAFDESELSNIMSFAAPYQYALYTFWVETGLRSSEIISLVWSDIDFENSVIDINKAIVIGIKEVELDNNQRLKNKPEPCLKTPKSDAGDRYVTLSEAAKNALKFQMELVTCAPNLPVFKNPRTKMAWHSDKTLRNDWHRLVKRAGITEKLVPYKFRNTFCVRGLKTRDIIDMKQEMGHANLSPIINNYAKPAKQKKK